MKLRFRESTHELALWGMVFAIACFLGSGPEAFAQRVYAYVDENGVRVLTNIPPKDALAPAIADLPAKIQKSGAASTISEMPKSVSVVPARTTKKPSHAAVNGAKVADLNPIIEKYAGEYRLDPSLVRSIIATESGFNPWAVSNKGARGLMQLMPATASRLGVQNIHDPEENIRGGTKHLRTLLDTFDNDLGLSLAAYNAGENLVQRIRRIPDIPETRAYVHTIQKRYGNKEMVFSIAPKDAARPAMFRFVDSSGTLHLTNIPPTQRTNAESPSFVQPTTAP